MAVGRTQAVEHRGEAALADTFRRSMRRFASTVSVITTRHARDGVFGMTATAVASLTADPPSMLVCINRSSSFGAVLKDAAEFCVNILYEDQEHISRAFGSSQNRERRFEVGAWKTEGTEPPCLADAQANILCRRMDAIEYESHTIFIGKVNEIRMREQVGPLLYLDGNYRAARAALPCAT